MAEEEKTAITSSSIKKSLESKKYLKVLVIAQPQEKTKHLGDASEPGSWNGPISTADTFYLPMVVFGYKVELKIPFELMNKSGYFMNQLEGPWKNKTVVEIPLKNQVAGRKTHLENIMMIILSVCVIIIYYFR